MIEVYHQNEIEMLKLGCTLPKLANICLQKSTDSKFHPLTESDKDLSEKIREDMVNGTFIALTQKQWLARLLSAKSTSLCKSTVGIDAS